MIPKSLKLLASGVAAASISAGASAATLGTFDGTTVTVGGFVKFDAIVSSYSDGELAGGSIGRDFYVPSVTPVSDGSADSRGPYVDFHARQSRFNIGTTTDLDGHKLKTFIELGFLATPSGNERITNSYEPRMRHAFLTYDNWLFGQTWTTFQNVGALPETADFVGNTDFGIFARQAQIRYTSGNWMFAIENPESTITPYGGGTRIVSDDNGTPDLVARYNFNSGGLNLAAAVLIRQLAYEDGGDIDATTSSTGLSLSGKYTFENKNDIRFGVNTGSGMGRYIGLNVSNGAVLTADDELEAIDSTALYFAYRHFWTSKVRSTISYSTIDIDNDTDLTGNAIDNTNSVRFNVFYSPVPKLSLGWELAIANKTMEDTTEMVDDGSGGLMEQVVPGDEGKMTRFQFSAKLAF